MSAVKPNIDFNTLNSDGLKALALANAHLAAIGGRLTPVFLGEFSSDLTGLVAAVPAVINTTDDKVQLTAAQTAALSSGYNRVKGVRTTVKGQHPEKDVLLAYGIGSKTNRLIVSEVTAAIQKILDRAAAQPAEAAAFDITADDITALKDSLVSIQKADAAQESARATAPQTTAQRNATARRIQAGIKRIAGAGMRTFADNPSVYADFEAL